VQERCFPKFGEDGGNLLAQMISTCRHGLRGRRRGRHPVVQSRLALCHYVIMSP
jgi:hypothetical protein